jgi:hypothetical protein
LNSSAKISRRLSHNSKSKLKRLLLAYRKSLVLGLLVSSAKSSFDTMNAGIAQAGAKVMLLDHILADYGAETKEVKIPICDANLGRLRRFSECRAYDNGREQRRIRRGSLSHVSITFSLPGGAQKRQNPAL